MFSKSLGSYEILGIQRSLLLQVWGLFLDGAQINLVQGLLDPFTKQGIRRTCKLMRLRLLKLGTILTLLFVDEIYRLYNYNTTTNITSGD